MSSPGHRADDDSALLDESGAVEPGVLDREFFASLVENGSDAIISIDEESRILFANGSVERVFGYAPDELVGRDLTVIMPDRFRDAHHEALARYVDSGERTLDWQNVELPAEHADGHEVPLSITFEEHRYDGERIFSGIMRDVSERVAREERLERQKEQLEKFASIVSHDLRNPLQTAKADVALLEARHGEDELFDELDETLDRMDALVDDVLTLAKQGRAIGETDAVDVEAVAADAWNHVDAPDATLDVRDVSRLKADRERLETLFQNLFRNAVEHGGADVTVTVGDLDDSAGFYVADDGPGIPEAEREDVFEYGYTTDDDGTGFGLNIVEQIADAHGWRAAATDGARGARFEFRGTTNR